MEEVTPHVVVKVLEAPESDVGKGRARLDTKTREAIGAADGDIVEIVGKKGTAAKLFRVKEEDEGKGIIRVDGLVRRNLGVSIGDKVEVRKVQVLTAERVSIAPIISEGHMISFGEGIEKFVKRGLLKRPVTTGDVVIVPGIALMGGPLPFAVTATSPSGFVIVSEHTVMEILEDPVKERDLLSAEGRLPTMSAGLRRVLEARLQDLEGDLSQLEGESLVRVQRIVLAIKALLRELEEPTGDASDANSSRAQS